MDNRKLWERYCQYLRRYETVGCTVDISRMRFADGFLPSLAPKFEQAFAAMKALETGAIANPDEQRMVGHYWLRSPELSPTKEISVAITEANNRILAFAKRVHEGAIAPQPGKKFHTVVVIGIGGSALGPQLLSDSLGTAADKMRVLFCDNTDPDGIARLATQLGDGLKQTLFIVISKSGGTIETRNGALELAAACKAHSVTFTKQAIAVTCEGSKLDQQAISEGWLDRFPLWDWVGGRTSLFSPVGLLPAALQGLPIEEFLAGAKSMDDITRSTVVDQNPAALLAAMWFFAGDGRGSKDMVVLPYKDRLVLFSKYLQQLVMESLGKEKDLQGKVVNQGIAVYGNKGSTDQHAYVQQLREGLNNFFVTFIQVKEEFTASLQQKPLEVEPGVTSGNYLTGFFLGTRRALYENGRDSITITLDRLNAQSLGALIAMYDRTVGFYASLVGINAYHQPGVEAGKKAAAKVIDIQRRILDGLKKQPGTALTAEKLAEQIDAAEDVETVYQICDALSANAASGISRSGGKTPLDAAFAMKG